MAGQITRGFPETPLARSRRYHWHFLYLTKPRVEKTGNKTAWILYSWCQTGVWCWFKFSPELFCNFFLKETVSNVLLVLPVAQPAAHASSIYLIDKRFILVILGGFKPHCLKLCVIKMRYADEYLTLSWAVIEQLFNYVLGSVANKTCFKDI